MVDWRARPSQQTQHARNYQRRYYLILALLILATLGLVWRLIDLTVVNRAFLRGQGEARTVRTLVVPAHRGIIFDRNNEPLAISTPVDSVWVNPMEFSATNYNLSKLALLLHLPKKEIQMRLDKGAEREFVYLKRGIAPVAGAAVKALNIPGVYLQHEYRRFYPEGEVTAHILGFTNVDDHGQEGLELAYNQWLQGVTGLKKVLRDRLGHVVADIGVIREPKPGQNLTLSIDQRIQYFAYRELKEGVTKYQASAGSVVVLDIKTGEILAMVNWPSYNPHDHTSKHDGRYRNRAVTDLVEPGSTIKAFSMASALESNKYRINSHVDTSPGWIMVDGKRVIDAHNNGVLDLTTILKLSSNVGMTKITLSLPPQNLWNTLNAVGFGQLTESGFPGERSGLLPTYRVWNPFVLATLSFGYGMSSTLLQLTQAYAVLATGGCKRPISLIKQIQSVDCKQVLKPKVTQDILMMLESVLTKGGTAPLARVPGYRVTGKTGTSRIVGAHGYEKHRYNSIFVGIAPASNPRLVVAVILNDPLGKQYYAGYTSGPIFSHVMGEALRLLNVPPDDLENAAKPNNLPADQPIQLTDDK